MLFSEVEFNTYSDAGAILKSMASGVPINMLFAYSWP